MPQPPLSKANRRSVEKLLREGRLSHRDIALKLGLGNGTVSNVWRDLLSKDPVAAEKARVERESTQRQAKAGLKEVVFREWLSGVIAERADLLDPPPAYVPPPALKRNAHHLYPLLHFSDWHFEEIVRPCGVLGMNAYDTGVARRRVYRVVQAFRAWAADQRASGRCRMPELVVALNGDFLSGVLHKAEMNADTRNVVVAAIDCGRLIAAAVRDLAADFPRVRVYGTVGNHGRLPDDKKVDTKNPTRSFDFIAYEFARESTRAVKNVEWDIPDSYLAMYQVAGSHWCVQGHGNFVKQQLGIVGYGMRRQVSNLAANLGAAGRRVRYAFFGHFHNSNSAEFAGVKTFIGPSLIGTQEYGFLSSGSVNDAAQECYVFDRDLGHVGTQVFYGDGPAGQYAGSYPPAAA